MAATVVEVNFIGITPFVSKEKDLCATFHISSPINRNNADRITLCKVGEDPKNDICPWILAGATKPLQQEKNETDEWQEGKIVFSNNILPKNSDSCGYFLAYCDENGRVVGESNVFQFYSDYEKNVSEEPASISYDSSCLVTMQHIMDKLKDQSEQMLSKLYTDLNHKCSDLDGKINTLEKKLLLSVEIMKQNHKGKVNKSYEVLLNYYAEMCDTITNVNDFAHILVTLRVITPQDEKELRNTTPELLQVKKLLDRIVGPVEAGRPQVFYTLLNVMESSALQATQQLATDIKRSLGMNDGKCQGDHQLMQFNQRLSDLKTKPMKNKAEVDSRIAKIEEDRKHLLEGTRYVALYDFAKRQDDELSFVEGDIILYPTPTDYEGWMKGFIKRTGRQGLFPLNYVRLLF